MSFLNPSSLNGNQFRRGRKLYYPILMVKLLPHLGQESQQCKMEISAPRSGEDVSEDAQVKGTAAIPAGRFLWVFAHRTGLALWWPQGSGPAVVSGGKWEVTASFGQERDVGRKI